MPRTSSRASTRDVSLYRSKYIENPRNEATRAKWLDIYEEYAQGALTEKQVAIKYNLSLTHVSRIVKWSVYHLHKEMDPKVYKAIMLDRLRARQQKLDEYRAKLQKMRKGVEPRDVINAYKELRTADKLIAQVQSILSGDEGEGGGKVQVNVQINSMDKEVKVNESNNPSEKG